MQAVNRAAEIAELTRTGRAAGCRVRLTKAQMLRKAMRLQKLADDYAAKDQDDIAAEIAQSSHDLLVRASNISLPPLRTARREVNR